MATFYHYHQTPIGTLLLGSDGEYLQLLGFPTGAMKRSHDSGWEKDDEGTCPACQFSLSGLFHAKERQLRRRARLIQNHHQNIEGTERVTTRNSGRLG